FTSTYRSLWSGVGSGALQLDNPALVPGGLASAEATQDALRNALATLPVSTLQIVRNKGGLALNARWSEAWRSFLTLTSERRRGARPFGAVFGGGDGGGNVEVPESIDDTTHELRAGAAYADGLTSFNIALSASAYRNRIDTMSFENPLAVTLSSVSAIGPNAFAQGRYDLAPDNDYTSMQADYARRWPAWFDARLTASAALGRLRQNDTLIAPTTLALTGATLNGVAMDNAWNTTAALTRTSADARIDTQLFTLTLALSPARALALAARYRYDATDNKTAAYFACNPLTGQVGRLLNEGSGAAVVDVPAYLGARCDPAAIRALDLPPNAGDITVRNVPYEHTQQVYGVRADWNVSRTATLAADVEREEFRRRFREREKTWEDRLKLSYTGRNFDVGAGGSSFLSSLATLRAAVEYGERRGSAYATNPYREFTSASLGPLPASGNAATWIRSVDTFRKFDLADRRQGRVDLRAHFTITEAIDAGASWTGIYARYPDSEYGRRGRHDQNSAGVDVNYQAAGGMSLHGFYNRQRGRMQQRGLQSAGCFIGADGVTAGNFESLCAAAGGPLFPRSRDWSVRSRDVNRVGGTGARIELRRAVLDLDYLYVRARTAIDYQYGAGIVLTPIQQALAGSGWQDLKFTQHVLSASALVPITRNLAARLTLQHERGSIDDWHYDGLAENPVPAANAVYLDRGPENYRVTFAGVLVRLQL
ncbi:MAG TPA: MtrB/PioB family outer membrane beta-barrel protein, partial [Burkholderiaceae bacterium]|nr:MtrB/PioB family outer membrane beta-barrel protein [Burkholderiaceae bacterium]